MPVDGVDEGFGPLSSYAHPIVAFVGMACDTLGAFLRSQPGVCHIIDMRESERSFANVAQSCDEKSAMTLRRSWLRKELEKCNTHDRSGLFTVVLNVTTDLEIEELRWNARARIFQVGTETSVVHRQLPKLDPGKPQSFYDKLYACVDPGAFMSESILA